jgi:SAM-dependent methyltransferase
VVSERSLAEEWEAQSGAWERWTRTPGHDHHFQRYNWPAFVELIPPAGHATLDLGCGEGRTGVVLHDLGHVVTGVDIAPSLAQLASRTGAYENVLVADAAALPLGDHAFDLVVAFMSLQDMDDAAGALREAARVLVTGGYVVAAVVHPVASARLGDEAAERRNYFDVQRTVDELERDGLAFTFHQIHRPLEAWFALFLDAGFVIEDVREPRPGEQDIAADPRLARARAKPTFLHVRGRR